MHSDLIALLNKHAGAVRASEALREGISRSTLDAYVWRDELRKASRGTYCRLDVTQEWAQARSRGVDLA